MKLFKKFFKKKEEDLIIERNNQDVVPIEIKWSNSEDNSHLIDQNIAEPTEYEIRIARNLIKHIKNNRYRDIENWITYVEDEGEYHYYHTYDGADCKALGSYRDYQRALDMGQDWNHELPQIINILKPILPERWEEINW